MKKVESIEEIRLIQFEILKEVADYCDKNHLRYYLTGGTLLGAVRHKGFIPWDDDIDIAMPRPDYEKFTELTQGNLTDNFEVNVFENKGNHSRLFMRVVDNRTIYEHRYYSKKFRSALGIDVFPIDGVPHDKEDYTMYFRYIRYWKKQFALSQSAAFRSTNFLRGVVKTFASIPAKMVGRKRIYNKIQKKVRQYPFLTSENIGITTGVYLEKEICSKIEFLSVVDLEFENRVFHAPACYDKYLRQLYGDYMKLPKEQDRTRGHAFDVYWK